MLLSELTARQTLPHQVALVLYTIKNVASVSIQYHVSSDDLHTMHCPEVKAEIL